MSIDIILRHDSGRKKKCSRFAISARHHLTFSASTNMLRNSWIEVRVLLFNSLFSIPRAKTTKLRFENDYSNVSQLKLHYGEEKSFSRKDFQSFSLFTLHCSPSRLSTLSDRCWIFGWLDHNVSIKVTSDQRFPDNFSREFHPELF